MRTPLLEILREIPDHRALKVAGSILRPCCSIRSSRWWAGELLPADHEFIRIHRQSLNAAFARIALCAVLHGLRLILHGVDPGALESAFRATRRRSPSRPRPKGFGRSRWTAKPCAAASTPFATARPRI